MIYELIPFWYEFEQGKALFELDEGKYWLYFRQVFDNLHIMSFDLSTEEVETYQNKNYSQQELNMMREFLSQCGLVDEEVEQQIKSLI